MSKDRKSFAPGTLLAPIPPAMVTVGDMDNANVLTVAWTGILSTIPARTYISVRPSRHSYGILKERGEFVINLPSVSLARETDFVGIYTGAKMDKLEKCGLTKIKSERVSAPTIEECPIALECSVCQVLPMGSHDVFIADILSVSCRGDIIDENGKMRFDRANLLAYAHGEYYSLGDVVGRFGFSTDKPKLDKAAAKKSKTHQAKEAFASERSSHIDGKGTKNANSSTHTGGKKAKNTSDSTHANKENDIKMDTPSHKERSSNLSEHRPFYESAPRKRSKKATASDKNKGAPHGRRGAVKK